MILAGVARGEKGEIFAVRAPAGMRGGDSFGGKGNSIAAASGDHPEALLVLIFLEHSRSNGVRHPLAVEA